MMRYVEGRHAIAALATLATVSAVVINVAAPNGRSGGTIVTSTLLVALFAALLCYAPSGNARRDTLVLGVAIADLIVLAPDANRGTPLMLAIVLAIRVSSRYGVRVGTGVVAVAVAGLTAWTRVLHPERSLGLGPDRGVIPVTLVALVVFGLLIALANAVRAEAAARAELLAAHRALQRDAERAEELAALRERARIAMDLHDALGHGLTTAAVQLQSASRLQSERPRDAEAFIRRAEASVAGLLSTLRETVGSLRDSPFGAQPLDTALERLAETLEHEGRMTVERDIAPVSVAPAVAAVLYRVAQEALTNTARHAHASTVRVQLTASGDDVVFSVVDDGVGIAADARPAGNGLQIMRERVAAVHGSMRFESAPNAGTRIDVRLPRGTPGCA